MTWFKVDDGLHSHLKAVRAGIPAMGLWVMAGSWCAANLTDGWIPDYIAVRLDPDYEEHAAMLVKAGLWVKAKRNGESGWRFHEWNEPGRQPVREQVLADRAANAQRQAAWRERAKREREARQQSQADSRSRNGVTTSVTNGDVTASITGAPTRPDPTRPVLPTEVLKDVPPSAGADAPRPEPAHEPADNAQAVVAAYLDGAAEAGQDKPTGRLIGRVGGDAKRLIGEGVSLNKLTAAARHMGAAGWSNLDQQLQRDSAERNGQSRRNTGGRKHQPFRNPDPADYDLPL
jgi:hypothetical protein